MRPSRRTLLHGGCAAFGILRPSSSQAVQPLLCDPDISVLSTAGRENPDVSVLTTPGSKKIVIVGTAHVSKDDETLVRQVIREVQPDTVMVELDKGRAVSLMRKAKARKTNEAVASNGAAPPSKQQTRGAAFYQSLDEIGFPAGGEFVAAIEEARALNATVLLGDQDFNVTMRRLKEAEAEVRRLRSEGKISREAAMAAADKVPSSLRKKDGPLTAEAVTQMTADLKQRDNARAVVDYMKRAAPPVYEAMIGERDRYMARALEVAPGTSVVAVVGLSHLEGIERILREEVLASPASCAMPLLVQPRAARR